MNKLLVTSVALALVCTAVCQTPTAVDLTDDEETAAETNAVPATAATTNAAPVAVATTNAAPTAEGKVADKAADGNDSAKELREQGIDEIDLEEIDDAAEAAAKRPTVKSSTENIEFVDISCDEATLADVLRQFRKTTKANIISDDSTNLQKRVSAELRHVPWLDALQSILNSRGFRLEKRGDIHFVVEEKRVDPLFTRTFALNHAASDELAKLFNDSYSVKDKSGKVTQHIANSFPEANVVVVTATEKVLTDCEDIIKAVDRAVAQIYIEARFLELSSNASHQLGLNWESLAKWGINATDFKVGIGHTEGDPANYGSGLTTKSISNNDTDSSTTTDSPTSSGSSVSSSKNKTSSETGTYTGLFPSTINDAAGGALKAADMAWRDSFGYSGQLSADQFRLALSAFETMGEGKVFSNPKIIVANGKEAKVDMTVKEPNVSVEANYTGTSSQNMNISTKLEVIPGNDKLMFAGEAFFSYGITLTVKPRISPDGLINVEIIPTISESAGIKEVKGATEQAVYTTYPKINVKRLTTNFTMKDGATAVIGGLTQTKEEDVDDGIPYLRKIPWIGQRLFGRIQRQKVQSEIIVFVTVGIANPQNLPKNIGLPTNAVLGREYVEGKRLEPGLRTGSANEILTIDRRPLEEIAREPLKPREEDEKRGTVSITISGNPDK